MYLGRKQLANFRTRGPRDKHKNSEKFKKRPGMSADHLTSIREMPCCACKNGPGGEAHHLKADTGERGMGLRSTDRWTVPLCRNHHDEVERAGTRNERSWFAKVNIEPALLAHDLWINTGDFARMVRVLLAHKQFGSAARDVIRARGEGKT